MALLNTDTAVLSAEAGNFERISGELRSIIGNVQASATMLAGHMQGEAGTAAQQALSRFDVAANQQVRELDDISANIAAAGIQYAGADAEHASSLAVLMNL